MANIDTDIGTIAEPWKLVCLQEVAEKPRYGYTASAAKNGDAKFLRITDITEFGVNWHTVPYCECSKTNLSKYELKENDILFARIGATTGKTCIVKNAPRSVFASYLIRVRVKNCIDADYLYFFLQTSGYWTQINSSKHDNLKKGVNAPILSSLLLPLPPLEEQRKIAKVLSMVQDAIAQQDRLITITSELKKNLMQKLFTEGTHWDVVPLKKTGEVIYGIQASVANKIEPLGTKILTNKNINLNGEFNFEKQNYFEITTERHRKTILKKGDILFNWRSGSKEHVGKTAYFDLDGEYTHSSFILRIRPYPTVNGRYIFHYLTWLRESNYFVKLQSYAINAKFNKSAVDALPTLLPTPEEQDNIAFSLDFLSDRVNQHRAKRNTLNDLFRTLLHQLMTAQIRVDDLNLSALNLDLKAGNE